MSFGFVVDDAAPDKRAAGGALSFAAQLGDRPPNLRLHRSLCPTCALWPDDDAERLDCVGVIATPIPPEVESWLVQRLPDDLDSLPGFLLRKVLLDFGYDGALAKKLRTDRLLLAPGPYERHYGPFFRRFVVSSEQIMEELLCAGDIQPSHALAILLHLGCIELDERIPLSLDEDGPKFSALIERPAERKLRTRWRDFGSETPPASSLGGIQALLRALYAGFVLDVDVYVRDSQADLPLPASQGTQPSQSA